MTYKEFVDLVDDMRTAQKLTTKKRRDEGAMIRALHLEARVDRWIAELRNPTTAEKTLFDWPEEDRP